MKVQAVITLCALASISFAAPQAKADTYMTTTTSEGFPSTITETRETTIAAPVTVAPAPVVIRDNPVIVAPPSREVVVVKKRGSHHLLNLGVVKVF
ncbi:MAG TPA: hypothetical protein V6C76_07110 [Drouetiella sp.]